jgi:alpha-glucosidase (family GH31 glycosyl hydrolase)
MLMLSLRARSLFTFTALLLLTSCGGCPPGGADAGTDGGEQEGPGRITTPRWAFEPWISKDISTGPDTYNFVEGFQTRDIPVGVVVLDSPWETNYNTFIPNDARYPDFGQMVQDLRDDDIRIVLWVTQMINDQSFDIEVGGDIYDGPSPNLRDASRNDYLVNNGETYLWWKGTGAGLDFFNPDAADWWHAQQDPLLIDVGINGWKLDFGEEYITTDTVLTAAGEVSHQAYSERYYQDFYEYGVRTRGADEFVTMVRPYDESYGFEGRFFARPEHAPVLWVGDQLRNWEGLSDGFDHVFRSADAGYVVLGWDIGGYLDNVNGNTLPFDAENLFRWTAASGLLPFFQLHGRANLEPWNIPERADEYVDCYRYWATFHHELVPFFYSLAEEGYGDGTPPFEPIVRPHGELASWAGDYRFDVGEAFFVAPILDATGIRDVALPAGGQYAAWFDLATAPVAGGQTLTGVDHRANSCQIPTYLKEGAIVPAVVDSNNGGLAPLIDAGALTVLVYPGSTPSAFVLHDERAGEVTITASAADGVSVPDVGRAVVLQIRAEAEPTSVDAAIALDPVASPADLANTTVGWAWDAARRLVFVKLGAGAHTVTIN